MLWNGARDALPTHSARNLHNKFSMRKEETEHFKHLTITGLEAGVLTMCSGEMMLT